MLSLLSLLFCLFLLAVPSAVADSSHVRVIRLSLVNGDVRFTREAHGDPLADAKAVWETAQANLPIRQGYVVATDSGRAEVEFENGALAFLDQNTVLDFYDLSLHDGARTTRLVLRQGSASFYVNPAGEDYFSVTGGDFTVEASSRASFRINNFDDGSNLDVSTGRVSVVRNEENFGVSKGQSFSVKVGEDKPVFGRAASNDDFDHWVSGRIDTVSNATTASAQYTASPYYAPGFADLYTYGSWFDCGGYGYGWRPFGASFGWSPFSMGQWLLDPSFGWTFASFEPWGWAPYHYGGWLFDSGCGGWFYSPPPFFNYGVGGFGGRRFSPRVHPPHPLVYRASTAVFVRQNDQLGIVPMHPLDKPGATPLNLGHGVFAAQGHTLANAPLLTAASGAKWETVKSPTHDSLTTGLAPTTAPERISRSLIEGNGGTRVVSLGQNSSIAYDPREHRFVNTNSTRSEAQKNPEASSTGRVAVEKNAAGAEKTGATIPNPPAPRSSGGASYRAGGTEFSGGGSSRGSSAAPAPAPHASAPSGGGGGKPH